MFVPTAITDDIGLLCTQDSVSIAALRHSFRDYLVRFAPRSRYLSLRCFDAVDVLDLLCEHGFICNAETLTLGGDRIQLNVTLRLLLRISGRLPHVKQMYWFVCHNGARVDITFATRYCVLIAQTPLSTRVNTGDTIDLFVQIPGDSGAPRLWSHIPIDL